VRGTLTVNTLTANDIARGTGGSVEQPGRDGARGVSTDSRSLREGELFVALRGPRFDAHEHVGEALRRGAWGAMVEEGAWRDGKVNGRASEFPGRAIISVGDTARALGDLAAWHRSRLDIKVIAITGSNGKTTTKEMTASIAGRRWNTHKTEGNFNNLIGLPLTVLGLDETHEAAVLEMGMNRRGEIGRLARIARPDVGVVTNVGPAHLEHLGTLEAVAAAKGELIETLGSGATAVLNADDQRVAALASSFPGRVITFGLGPDAVFRALEIRGGEGGVSFTLSSPSGTGDISLPFPGEHNVRNALAAAAAAFALGAGLDVITEGLAAVRPLPMRFALHSYLDGIRVVNDAYNANPDSMESALRSLRVMESRGRRAAVLGDMLELGEESPGAHRRLGAAAAASSLDLLVTVGRFAEETARGAVEAGLPREKVVMVPDCGGAADALGVWLGPGDLVLVKGSRGVALEEVLRLLESEGKLREN